MANAVAPMVVLLLILGTGAYLLLRCHDWPVRVPAGSALAALLLMVLVDAAALGLFFTDVFHLLFYLFAVWLISGLCSVAAWLLLDQESRLAAALEAVGFVGRTAFVGGPAMVFTVGAVAALLQGVVLAALLLVPVSLLLLAFQYRDAKIAVTSVMIVVTSQERTA
jgi:hypothetical protein